MQVLARTTKPAGAEPATQRREERHHQKQEGVASSNKKTKTSDATNSPERHTCAVINSRERCRAFLRRIA